MEINNLVRPVTRLTLMTACELVFHLNVSLTTVGALFFRDLFIERLNEEVDSFINPLLPTQVKDTIRLGVLDSIIYFALSQQRGVAELGFLMGKTGDISFYTELSLMCSFTNALMNSYVLKKDEFEKLKTETENSLM